MNSEPIAVDIITGFLGAGKTTLINKFLAEGLGTSDTALIENEFGDVAIDDDIVDKGSIQVTTMATGCICCTLQGDFITSISQIVEQYHPKRLIIEPTGLANLADLLTTMERAGEHVALRVNSVITVASAENLIPLLTIGGDFFRQQLEQAQFIVVSCVQEADEEDLQDAVDAVMEVKREQVPVLVKDWNEVDALEILSLAEEAHAAYERSVGASNSLGESHGHDHEHEHDHEHDHDHGHEHRVHKETGITSHAYWPAKAFSDSALQELAEKLQTNELGTVVRAKGFLKKDDGSCCLLETVYGRTKMQPSTYDGQSKFVVIGRDLHETELQELLS